MFCDVCKRPFEDGQPYTPMEVVMDSAPSRVGDSGRCPTEEAWELVVCKGCRDEFRAWLFKAADASEPAYATEVVLGRPTAVDEPSEEPAP